MNYQTVYDQFIADRRANEAGLSGYTERHHIVPRALGGGNEAGNLIRLTAEDHYFAHCCLAKIHGGAMWFALNAIVMLNGRNGNKFSRRRMIDAARRETNLIQSLTTTAMWREGKFPNSLKRGASNGNHNPTLHSWLNLDNGMRRDATIMAMHQEFGGNRPAWTQAQTGVRQTAYGWTIVGRDIRVRGLKGRKIEWRHSDGSELIGTQKQFCESVGVSAASACRLARGQVIELRGWSIA